MGEATTKSGSLTMAIRTLEQLLKNHIMSMEIEDKQTPLPPPAPPPPPPAAALAVVRPKPTRKTSRMKLGSVEEEEAMNPGKVRTDKVTVIVRVIFMKIGTIDTIHDRFSADVMVLSKWREPALDHTKEDSDHVEWDNYWDPKLMIANGIGDMKYTVSYSLHRDPPVESEGGRGGAIVCEHRHCQGQFFEFMELNKFPFDSQDLTVNVTSDRTEVELEFVENEEDPSGVNTGAFSAEQEWSLDDKVNVWKKLTTKKSAKGKIRIPNIFVAAKASRRPQFFIYNIIIIMFSISSLAFSTFTVKLETPESRLPLTYILVLTTVTFKFVVNKSLPKISYLTYLDKYILGSMIILCCVCVWHALAGSVVCFSTFIPPPPTTPAPTAANSNVSCAVKPKCIASPAALTIDYIALGCLATVYIGFHIVFLVLINYVSTSEGPNEEIDLGDPDDDDDGGEEGGEDNHQQHQEGEEDHQPNGFNKKVLLALETTKSPSSDDKSQAIPTTDQVINSANNGKTIDNNLPPIVD